MKEGFWRGPVFRIPFLDAFAPLLAVGSSSALTNTTTTSFFHISMYVDLFFFSLSLSFPLPFVTNVNKKSVNKKRSYLLMTMRRRRKK